MGAKYLNMHEIFQNLSNPELVYQTMGNV